MQCRQRSLGAAAAEATTSCIDDLIGIKTRVCRKLDRRLVQQLRAHDCTVDGVDFKGEESLAKFLKVAGRELVQDVSDVFLQQLQGGGGGRTKWG